MKNPSASFYITAYPGQKGFCIPQKVTQFLDLHSRSNIALKVTRTNGDLLYQGISNLTSGTEVTSVDACRRITPGEELRLEVSRAPDDNLAFDPNDDGRDEFFREV